MEKAAAKSAAIAFFLFFTLPFAYAQNYPLLSPGFNIEENTEQETEQAKINTIRMYWELPAGSAFRITAGERLTLILRANAWSSQQPLPAFFMPEVPQGLILFPSAVSAEERANGIAVKFTVIPLAAGEIVLPARTLQYENIRFQIPALNININKK